MGDSSSKIVKLITFNVADYWFALPMKATLKVVNCPASDQGGIVSLGMVQLGAHTIQLLDLYGVYGLNANAALLQHPPFLLVLRRPQDKLCGIALESPPDLVELPLNALQCVSADRRFVPKKQWISHIAILSEQTMNRTLLLLDMAAIFQPALVHA